MPSEPPDPHRLLESLDAWITDLAALVDSKPGEAHLLAALDLARKSRAELAAYCGTT